MNRIILSLLCACVLLLRADQCRGDSLYVDIYLSDCYTGQALNNVLLHVTHFDCSEQRYKYLEEVKTDRLGRIQIPLKSTSFLKRPIQIVAEHRDYVQKTDTFLVEMGRCVAMCLEPTEPIKVTGAVKSAADNMPLEGVRIACWLNPRSKSTFRSETCTSVDGRFKWVFGIDYLDKIMKYRFTKPGFKSHKGEITLSRENELPIYLAPTKLVDRQGGLGKDLPVFIGSFVGIVGSFIYFSFYHNKD